MDDDALLEVLHRTVDAVGGALAKLDDWGSAGTAKAGQYTHDLVADAAALEVLTAAGLGVLSEESGRSGPDGPLLAVVDPVDGSTNASRGIPWYACSVCVLDPDGPRVAVVAELAARERRFQAVRGGGATCDGRPLAPSGCRDVSTAIVGMSGLPPQRPAWAQSRMLGAAALEICAVAEGTLDAFVDWVPSALGAWDYMGALLVCSEAGARVADAYGRELIVRDHAARRTPVAGATPELVDQLLALRPDTGQKID